MPLNQTDDLLQRAGYTLSLEGLRQPNNGLLLRQDLHTLFDRGYITLFPDHDIEVSKRIKEDYGNGREYYSFHGKKLIEVPGRAVDKPVIEFLQWHNEECLLGWDRYPLAALNDLAGIWEHINSEPQNPVTA